MDRNRSYPLASWRIQGFKAIRDDTCLDLGGLNILVGSNSAGKSSVLQSILLASQSLGTPLADRPLVLNGPLVRLGLAEDCVHENAEKVMSIGFELATPAFSEGRTSQTMSQIEAIKVLSSFKIAKDGTREFQLSTTSVRVEPSAEDNDSGPQEIAASKWNQKEALETFRGKDLRGNFAKAVARTDTFRGEGDLDARSVAVHVSQFLPSNQILVTNFFLKELDRLRRSLMTPFLSSRRQSRTEDRTLTQQASQYLRRFASEAIGEDALSQLGEDERISYRRVMETDYSREFMKMHESEWYQNHADDLPVLADVDFEDFAEPLERGLQVTRRWFASSVRHLGPLRASPQPLYNLPEAASGDSVGRNGEYTAAVLDTYGSRSGVYPMPSGTQDRSTLSEAVDSWMSYLGLVDGIQTAERGRLGYEYSVNVAGVERDLDLTTVGVGVSQALPVVVLGLVSMPGTLVLYEQPELHLHPDVQANLGDFFLALAESGRQLIVETHSEYFINRLRRRQSADQERSVKDLTRIFFFERSGNSTEVSRAAIGKDGSMPNWPRGFLDTAAREMRQMLRESAPSDQ